MRRHLFHSTIAILVASSIGAAIAFPPSQLIVPSSGPADKRLASFDKLMTDFLKAHPRIPGAALAVGRNGKLVYSRGFGYADHEHKHVVQAHSQFRIASVSKPLTAVAIPQLVERGKLKLDDEVFDVLKLEEPKGKGVKFDARWRKVTIQHLLNHTGGWDRDKSFDPMFVNGDICETFKIKSPAMQHDIIRYMLRRPLDFNPGSRDAYSNFGYCLLGRVIERVSGKGYEEYVRDEVLLPVGAHDTRLGKTLLEQRFPNEVWYWAGNKKLGSIMAQNLGKPTLLPYGPWCLETLDSHGGWIASAADLIRFAAAFDHPKQCKLLSARSIETMFAVPAGAAGHTKNGKTKDAYYACGWEVRPYENGQRNAWHGGLLDGTSTLLVRRLDGLSWAVLFNSNIGEKDNDPADLIDGLVHDAADAVKEWP